MGHRVSSMSAVATKRHCLLAAAAAAAAVVVSGSSPAQKLMCPLASNIGVTNPLFLDRRGASREKVTLFQSANTCTVHKVLGTNQQSRRRKCNMGQLAGTVGDVHTIPTCVSCLSSQFPVTCYVGGAPASSPLLRRLMFAAVSRKRNRSTLDWFRPSLRESPPLLFLTPHAGGNFKFPTENTGPIIADTALHGVSILSMSISLSSTTTTLMRYNESARRAKRRDRLLRYRRLRWRFFRGGGNGERVPSSQLEYTDGDYAPFKIVDGITETEVTKNVRPFLVRGKDGKIRTRRKKRSECGGDGVFFRIPKPAPANGRARKRAQSLAATDVSTLRKLFGTNRNKFWGDLDIETARILYHTLLPRALIRLHAEGHHEPDELAPLAFEARMAAKQYVRERCKIPGRILAVVFDGFRHFRRYGKWSPTGLSWDELWHKYERQLQEETTYWDPSLRLEDLTSQVCLRILEGSCRSNAIVDRLCYASEHSVDGRRNRRQPSAVAREVLSIANKFDRDVQELLNRMEQERVWRSQHVFLLRLFFETRELVRWLGRVDRQDSCSSVGCNVDNRYESIIS